MEDRPTSHDIPIQYPSVVIADDDILASINKTTDTGGRYSVNR